MNTAVFKNTGPEGFASTIPTESKQIGLSTLPPKKRGFPKDHLTLQWMGLNLYSRGWVLKIASFEGSGSLGLDKFPPVFFKPHGATHWPFVFWTGPKISEKNSRTYPDDGNQEAVDPQAVLFNHQI